MCRLIAKKGFCLDVVSGGELYTAYKANFDMEKIYFHGNNKTERRNWTWGLNLSWKIYCWQLVEMKKIKWNSRKAWQIQKYI